MQPGFRRTSAVRVMCFGGICKNCIFHWKKMEFTEAYDDTCSNIGLCCRTGNKRALIKLLDAGKTADVMDNRGWRPCHEAANGNHVSCLRLLLNHRKNDVNWTTHEGETPLLLAARKGHEMIVRLLVRNGARIDCSSNEFETPLIAAAAVGSLPCVKQLTKKGANVFHADYSGQTALHAAANVETGAEVVRHLLWCGACPTVKDSDNGFTPIFLAAMRGFTDCLTVLLFHSRLHDLGAVDITADDGTTPLMIATQHGHLDCIKLLVNYEANVNYRAPDNVMALHLATTEGHIECLKYLLPMTDRALLQSCALDPRKMDCSVARRYQNQTVSPFHLAINNKHYATLEYLLEQQLDPETFLQYTSHTRRVRNTLRMVDYLDDFPKCITALGAAAVVGDERLVTILLSAGSRLNPSDENVCDPLVMAILYGHPLIVEQLLAAGADPNHRSPKEFHYYSRKIEFSPMIAAKVATRIDIQYTLLLAGADVRRIHLPFYAANWRTRFLGYNPAIIPDNDPVTSTLLILLSKFTSNGRQLVRKINDACYHSEPIDAAYYEITVPNSLARLCRISIREHILDCSSAIHFRRKLESLPLPSLLVQYVAFDTQT